jgi:hypothetical protein
MQLVALQEFPSQRTAEESVLYTVNAQIFHYEFQMSKEEIS